MDINLNRIIQGDDSKQCLPKKVEGHLLNRKGKVPGRVGGKENNLFKDLLQSILVKGVATETSPENYITIMA
jgi:hypothetical protein